MSAARERIEASLGASAAPAAAVVLAAVVLWLLSGASAWETARYLGYEVGLVIMPGWLLLRAVAPRIRSGLVQLSIAWPLGIAIELAAFAVTAGLDLRDALPFMQLAVALLAGAVVWRARREAGGQGHLPPLGSGPAWALAALIVATFAYIALTLFVTAPLPGSVEYIRYPTDVFFHISVAADLKQQLPPSTPEVADVPLHYHYFFYVHNAAASQVTGVELPVIALRFMPLALAALVMIVIAAASRVITAIAWCAPIAAALFLVTSELDLLATEPFPFLGVRDIWLWLSPTYMLGLAHFLTALTLAAALVDPRVGERIGIGRAAAWGLLAVIGVAGSGAKSVVLPMLVAGFAVYVALAWLRDRRPDPTGLRLLALSAAVFAGSFALLYLGGSEGGLELKPGGLYERMAPMLLFEPSVPDSLPAEVAFWGGASLLASLLLFGSFAAPIAWRLAPGRAPFGAGERLLACMLVPGLAAWFLLYTENADNSYFTALGLCAALPLAASGTWRAIGALGWLRSRRGALALVLFVVALGLLAGAGWALVLDDEPKAAYFLVYGPVLLAAAATGVWLLRSAPGKRPLRAAAATLAVLAASGLNLLFDSAPEDVRLLARGETLYESPDPLPGTGIGRDEVEAAVWARDNLPADAVLATANDTERGPPPGLLAIRTEVPAIAERRVLYEGWAYSTRSQDWTATVFGLKIPYPDRRELQRRAMFDGDPAALREISERFGVSHLLLRRDDSRVPASVRGAGPRVFANEEFEIVELPRPPAS